MGLAWQQGPFGLHPAGRLLAGGPLGSRILYAEPAGRRMRVELAATVVAESDGVMILHETDRYPVAFFPGADVDGALLMPSRRRGRHPILGEVRWSSLRIDGALFENVAWSYPRPPGSAAALDGMLAFVWSAMDAFYEEDEQVLGHAVDPYHRVDIRNSRRRVTVHHHGELIADTRAARAVFETGFAPRWYLPRIDIALDALQDSPRRTLCPYKGAAHYFDVLAGGRRLDAAAWSYPDAVPEAARLVGYVSFDPALVEVRLDGERLVPAMHQTVVPTGPDRDLTVPASSARQAAIGSRACSTSSAMISPSRSSSCGSARAPRSSKAS